MAMKREQQERPAWLPPSLADGQQASGGVPDRGAAPGTAPSPAPTTAAAPVASGWAAGLDRAGRHLVDALRLMVGVPNYGAYVAHRQANHPGEPVMDYETFFRERQQARYGGGNGRIGRCC